MADRFAPLHEPSPCFGHTSGPLSPRAHPLWAASDKWRVTRSENDADSGGGVFLQLRLAAGVAHVEIFHADLALPSLPNADLPTASFRFFHHLWKRIP
jgi:hypothetical protein